MPPRLQFQLNVRTIHLDFVGAHPLRRRRAEHLAGADLELGTMPGASDLVALELLLSERATAMCTGVVDGVELTVYVEEGDRFSLHLDQLAAVRINLARLRYFDIFGHASLLDHSTFLRRAVLSGLVKTRDALAVPVVVRRNLVSPGGSRPIQTLA